jgi:hypothetical protein
VPPENLLAMLVGLDLPGTLPARPLKAEVEAADAGEQGAEAHAR